MKLLNCMVICMAALIILSCSKKVATYEQTVENGIRITKNTGVPADSTFKITIKEVGFLDMENEEDSLKFIKAVSNFDMDDQGNLYILDREKCIIHKYDRDFNFIKAFGRKGKGPGEFWLPGLINVRKDTLYLSNWTSLRVIKYDLNGNYLEDKIFPTNENFPSYPTKFGKENYISQSTSNRYKSDGKEYMIEEVAMYDNKFNFIKHLYKLEYDSKNDIEHDPSELGSVAAFSDSVIYISENSKDRYKIDVYNSDGVKIREINKNYAKTKANEKEAQALSEAGAKYGMKYKMIYKNSINYMQTDKCGRLWILANGNSEDSTYFEIYENDILLNKIALNIERSYSPYFIGDKIISLNYDNNNIKIYEY